MPPKRSNGVKAGAAKKTSDKPDSSKPESSTTGPSPKDDSKEDEADKNQPAQKAKKRKAPPSEGSRKSARSAPRAEPSTAQLVQFLLTPACADLVRPQDEKKALESQSSAQDSFVTYGSSELNPYQELVSAVVLSRPISHMLGLRTIRTLFNKPYSFSGARDMSDAGGEKIHKALFDARTQHKAKTADQLHALADVILDRYTDTKDSRGTQLGKVLGRKDVEKTLQELSAGINGLGPTGCHIFRRRVQWLWPAAFPFVDSRSGKGLRAMGLPDDGDELVDVLESQWAGVSHDVKKTLAGKGDEEKMRRAVVVVLEMATGADLEGKVDEVKAEAASVQTA